MENPETKTEFELWLKNRKHTPLTNVEILKIELGLVKQNRAKQFPDANFKSAYDMINWNELQQLYPQQL